MAKIRATRYSNTTIQKQIDDVKDLIRESVKEDVIALALNIHGRLVDNPPEGTPIDTGWASANWWVSVGTVPSDNDGSKGDVASAQSKQSSGLADILTYEPSKGVIYITNNTPYINRLNNGWSQQSPAGFVDRAVQIEITRFTHSTNYRAINRDD